MAFPMIGVVIRRRKWIILRALSVVTLVTLAGSYLMIPSYQASAKILIMKAKPGVPDLDSVALSQLSSMIKASPDVDVNKVLASSRPYINKMVLKLQLRDEKGHLVTADSLTQSRAMGRWFFAEPSLSISRQEETDILEIKTTSGDADEVMMMANTLADIVIDQNQVQMRAEYSRARDFLEDETGKVSERYKAALRNVREFKKQEKTIDLETETKLAAERMTALLGQKEEDVIALAEARARMSRLKEQLAKQRPEYLSAPTLKDNPQIETLKKRLTELRLELTQATADVTERHPQVLALKGQIDMAEAELRREIEIYRSSAPKLTALDREIVALEAHLKGVNEEVVRRFKDMGEFPDKAFEQAGLDMEVTVTQQAYSSLLDAMCQIGVAEATALSQIRVIEPAVKPHSPVRPNKPLNGALGVLVGLVFGLGLVLVMEYRDDSIRTAEDVNELRPIAFMGAVPRFQGKEIPLISGRDPNDPLFESYRRIRTHIDVIDHMRERPLKSLLVTSPGPREGKSTTAANLGICVAREGKKVALLDVDVRRASLHTSFDVTNDVGISDLLQGQTSIDEAMQPTRVKGLSLIPSGPPFPDPGGMIESDRMGQLLSELRTRFDLVILDSAPLLVKSDALVLARQVDGLILVLESEKTTRRAAYELIDLLTKAQIKPLGFVLNRFSVRKGAYSYQQYYYGHYGRGLIGQERDGFCLRAPVVGES